MCIVNKYINMFVTTPLSELLEDYAVGEALSADSDPL